MDPISEALMRSCIHDMANTLSGIQGILELGDPTVPVSSRDRSRLEAILTEGTSTLERARHLAMDTLPEASAEAGPDWRRHLEASLQPLSVVFRCAVLIRYEGDPARDQWPGDLARGFAQALTRQVLPYVHGGTLRILCSADASCWRIRWEPVADLPPGLLDVHGAPSRDIASRWAQKTGAALGVRLDSGSDTLVAVIPRH